MKKNIVILFFIVFSFLLILISGNKYDLGITHDSIAYLTGAKNIQLNLGYVDRKGLLINHYPPFYSIVLASFAGLVGSNLLDSALVINAILISLFFFFFNLILFRNSKNKVINISLNLILITSAPIYVFSMLWTEAMFMVLLISVYYLFLIYEKSKYKYGLLILMGILCGLLILTRYAGFPFVGLIIIYFFISSIRRVDQFKNLFLFITPFVLLIAIWILYTKSFHKPVTSRQLIYHPITRSHFNQLKSTLYLWITPFSYFISGFIYFILVLFILFYYRVNKVFNYIIECFKRSSFFRHSLISMMTYILFLFFSISFFDLETPLDNRILAPVFPFILILSQPFFVKAFSITNIGIKGLLLFLVLIVLGGKIHSSIMYWDKIKNLGQDYSSQQWSNSQTLQQSNSIRGFSVYSNCVDIIEFSNLNSKELEIFSLPNKYLPGISKTLNPNFESEMNCLKDNMLTNKLIIVFFNSVNRSDTSYINDLWGKFSKMKIIKNNDGFIIRPFTD